MKKNPYQPVCTAKYNEGVLVVAQSADYMCIVKYAWKSKKLISQRENIKENLMKIQILANYTSDIRLHDPKVISPHLITI